MIGFGADERRPHLKSSLPSSAPTKHCPARSTLLVFDEGKATPIPSSPYPDREIRSDKDTPLQRGQTRPQLLNGVGGGTKE
jgi:hypothetical protein